MSFIVFQAQFFRDYNKEKVREIQNGVNKISHLIFALS